MGSPTHLAAALLIGLLIVKSSAGKQCLPATVAAEVGTFGKMEAIQASTVMNLLAEQYTPKCLRAVILPEKANKSNPQSNNETSLYPEDSRHFRKVNPHAKNSKENLVVDQTMINLKIILSHRVSHQNQETLKHIKKNTARLTPYACITYMMPEAPDSQLLGLLTNASSNNLTQYFLVHAKDTVEAERFLLDQRLGKEKNMAAIIPQTHQNSTYWRVLIRQLLHPSGSPKVLSVNKWSSDTGLANTNDIFLDQMANFYGTKLIASTLHNRPFVDYEIVEGSRAVIPKPSIYINTLDAIAYKLNFTYDIVMPADGEWGVLKDDGHWSGVMGDVEFGRANVTLGLVMMQERAKSLDFTMMFFMDALTFITAKSPPSAPWQKLITPFQLKVWVCVVVSVCGGVLLYHVFYHIQATISSSRFLDSHAYMRILASFLSQSLHGYLWLPAGRVFLGFWFLYVFLVTTHYKTSLTSNLAVPFIPPPLDTIQQLLGSNLKYGMNDVKGAPHQLFATSRIPLYQRLWRDLQFYNDENSMRMVVEGTFSYINYRTFLVLQMLRHNSNPRRKTDLYVATEQFFPTGSAWYFPKGAPYQKNFNTVIWRCVEAGLINKWLYDLYAVYVKEYQDQKSSQKQDTSVEMDTRLVVFTLNHLQGAFYLFFLGNGCGLLLLFLELLLAPHTHHPDDV